jgi:hypothetical protein
MSQWSQRNAQATPAAALAAVRSQLGPTHTVGLVQPVNIVRFSGPLEPSELRALTTAEIALRWLPQLAQSGGSLSARNSFGGAKHAFEQNREPDVEALLARLSDAWSWLISHGLVGPMPGTMRVGRV